MDNMPQSNMNMQQNSQPQMPIRHDEPLNKNLAMICGTVVLLCLIVSAALLYSKSITPVTTTNTPGGQQQQQNPTPTGPVKVTIDDDAVLGDKNAPVTMIEFSDYECPFCKRHFMEVFPQIKKDYIDTGKVKLVFRDFIAVPAHNPLATTEAIAAQCAKDQGGDNAYFTYHDALFTKTTSNGSGLAVTELPKIAQALGLNVSTFQKCLDSKKFADEVAKDNAYALTVLPSPAGTPSFFVGKSSTDGIINGNVIVGAYPFADFKAAIDKALAE